MKDDNDKSQLEMKERKKMNETGKRKKAKKAQGNCDMKAKLMNHFYTFFPSHFS